MLKLVRLSTLKQIIIVSMTVLVGLFANQLRAQEIVIAFQDTLGPSTTLDGTARTYMLIRSMARADVKQAMFLIRTKTITANTLERMMHYDETGQFLVNAGHSYSMLHASKNFGYPIDIMKANAVLEDYQNYHKHVFFPYLYDGRDADLLAQLRNYLVEHNYSPTYVTTRVHDEYMNRLYHERTVAGRSVDIRQLEKAYTKMILDAVIAYDAKARTILGFSPRQVLLLHENDIAAYCIVSAIDALNGAGFKVISPEKVFTDPVANPYFVSGFSAVSYMPYITGIPDSQYEWNPVATPKDEEKINNYLIEQGLQNLIPQ